MKFAVVVVLVALALGANSSVIPIGWPGTVVVGNPHGAISIDHSPLAHLGSLAAVDIHGLHGIHDIHGIHGIHSPVQIVNAPHAVIPAVVPAVVPGATSVSKTRGALHVAPLPGHAHSVVQANLQPAPGTW